MEILEIDGEIGKTIFVDFLDDLIGLLQDYKTKVMEVGYDDELCE